MDKIFSKIRSNEGSMLLLTLITITVLIILGVSALNVASTEAKISRNELNRQKAIDLAEAGIAHAYTTTNTLNQTSFSNTFSDGTRYNVDRTYTPDTLEFYVVSSGNANGVTKTIKTKYNYIKNLSQIKSTVIADNISLQQSGTGTESKGEIEKGSLIANLQTNISGNVQLEDGASLYVGSQVDTSGFTGITPNIMNSKFPVPQIDIKYYEGLANGNILPPGSYNLNNATHTYVNGYDLYFIDGDATITANMANNNPAIVIATGNVSLQSQIGSSNRPVFIYSGNILTVNGSSTTNFEVQGVIIAKNSINITNMSEVEGTLIAPTVSVTGGKWELEYNSNILSTSLMTNIKLTQNKKVATWIENEN